MQLTLEETQYLLDESTQPLTEELLQVLVENRIEYIKSAMADKLSTAHDPESSNLSAGKIIDHIAKKVDPTTRKTQTEWLVNRYHAGEFKLGDSKAIKKTMSTYEEAVPHMENKDIKSFKSLGDLRDAVATTHVKRKMVDASDNQPVETGETKLYDQDGVQGFKLTNKKTSIHNYGPNGKVAKTSWCTASEGANNQFAGYAGGKYPMRFPNGEVLQIHHQSAQLQDVNNRPVSMADPRFAPYKEHIENFIKQTADSENLASPSELVKRHVPTSSDELQPLIDKHTALMAPVHAKTYVPYGHSRHVREAMNDIKDVIQRSRITDPQFEHLKNVSTLDGWNDTPEPARLSNWLANSPHLQPHQVTSLVDDLVNRPSDADDENFKPILVHPNISDHDIHKLIGWSGATDKAHTSARRSFLLNTPSIKEEHLDRINPSIDEREAMIDRSMAKSIPDDYFRDVMHKTPHVVAENPITPAHVLRELHDTKAATPALHTSLLKNPNLPKDVFMKAVTADLVHPVDTNIRVAVERPDLEPSERSMVVKRHMDGKLNDTGFGSFAASNRLSRDDIHTIINHPDLDIRRMQSVISNPKIRHGELERIVNHPKFSSDVISDVIESPYIRSSTVDALTSLPEHNREVLDQISKTHSTAIEGRHLTQVLSHPTTNFATKVAALKHPANTPEHFHMLKDNPRFHGAISNSVNAPPSILHGLSSSPADHVRLNVANNPNTEPSTLNILSTDSVPEIAAVAKKKLK